MLDISQGVAPPRSALVDLPLVLKEKPFHLSNNFEEPLPLYRYMSNLDDLSHRPSFLV